MLLTIRTPNPSRIEIDLVDQYGTRKVTVTLTGNEWRMVDVRLTVYGATITHIHQVAHRRANLHTVMSRSLHFLDVI